MLDFNSHNTNCWALNSLTLRRHTNCLSHTHDTQRVSTGIELQQFSQTRQRYCILHPNCVLGFDWVNFKRFGHQIPDRTRKNLGS